MPESAAKNGWHKHRFDEMALMVNDRIDDPSEADVEYYVGLEHLDSDSLTIRRWGSPSDVEATKLRFRTGDIIFGRRRVYQRKLAVAEFDGICSAHAMVLRAKPKVVLPLFLPFFMQSDLFMERAKEISVGSLSPTINWKTLASEEFALPPMEEQKRMAEALGAFQTATESLKDALVRARQVHRSVLDQHFTQGASAMEECRVLEELTTRINDGTHQPPPFVSSGVPFLLVSNITKGRIDWIAEKYISREVFEQLSKAWRPQKDDVLYSLVGSYGVPAMVDRETLFTFQRHIGLIRPDPGRLLPKFLYWYLTSPSGVQQAHLRAEGLAQKTITLGALRSFRVPAPTLERQSQIVLELDAVQEAINSLENRVSELKSAANALVGGFGGSC
jgi:type I restriction enzyme, S subunit